MEGPCPDLNATFPLQTTETTSGITTEEIYFTEEDTEQPDQTTTDHSVVEITYSTTGRICLECTVLIMSPCSVFYRYITCVLESTAAEGPHTTNGFITTDRDPTNRQTSDDSYTTKAYQGKFYNNLQKNNNNTLFWLQLLMGINTFVFTMSWIFFATYRIYKCWRFSLNTSNLWHYGRWRYGRRNHKTCNHCSGQRYSNNNILHFQHFEPPI